MIKNLQFPRWQDRFLASSLISACWQFICLSSPSVLFSFLWITFLFLSLKSEEWSLSILRMITRKIQAIAEWEMDVTRNSVPLLRNQFKHHVCSKAVNADCKQTEVHCWIPFFCQNFFVVLIFSFCINFCYYGMHLFCFSPLRVRFLFAS